MSRGFANGSGRRGGRHSSRSIRRASLGGTTGRSRKRAPRLELARNRLYRGPPRLLTRSKIRTRRVESCEIVTRGYGGTPSSPHPPARAYPGQDLPLHSRPTPAPSSADPPPHTL